MRFILFVLFFGIFTIAYGKEHLKYFKHWDHPGKCVFDDLILSPGEVGQPKGKCIRLECQQADGLGSLKLCGGEGNLKPRCRLGDPINPNGSYPNCCERRVICN